MTREPRVSLVVMLYNEERTVGRVVRDLHAALEKVCGAFEILIVDDGSTDGSSAAARRLEAALSEVRVVRHEVNGGLGAVYRTGFGEAAGQTVTFFPADGQFPAANVQRLFSAKEDAELVLGVFEDQRRGLLGQALSRAERGLYRIWLGRIPRFQGLLMFDRSLLDEIELVSRGRGWGVLMEFVIRAYRKPCRTAWAKIELVPRAAGRSKVQNLRTVLSNLRQVLALRGRI